MSNSSARMRHNNTVSYAMDVVIFVTLILYIFVQKRLTEDDSSAVQGIDKP